MCGIAGFYGKKDDELLRGMTRSLIHRGPDEEGYYSDELASLGMRRMPFLSKPECVWVRLIPSR